MKVYLGQTRAKAWLARLQAFGFGEMTVREELPPRRLPFVFDNGAFKDWMARRPFDEARYEKALAKLREAKPRPDFIVVPDIVADGARSLKFSFSWLERLRPLGLPLYLVVQDGMGPGASRALESFDGLFVGGSLKWKLRTGRDWVDTAHLAGKPCHIGRFGTWRRVHAARRWGADSIDSALPLWSEGNFQSFLKGFGEPHPELFQGIA